MCCETGQHAAAAQRLCDKAERPEGAQKARYGSCPGRKPKVGKRPPPPRAGRRARRGKGKSRALRRRNRRARATRGSSKSKAAGAPGGALRAARRHRYGALPCGMVFTTRRCRSGGKSRALRRGLAAFLKKGLAKNCKKAAAGKDASLPMPEGQSGRKRREKVVTVSPAAGGRGFGAEPAILERKSPVLRHTGTLGRRLPRVHTQPRQIGRE